MLYLMPMGRRYIIFRMGRRYWEKSTTSWAGESTRQSMKDWTTSLLENESMKEKWQLTSALCLRLLAHITCKQILSNYTH